MNSPGACQFVASGWGPTGTVPLHVDKVVTGLAIPWGLVFLPNGDWLVTERAGKLRLIKNQSQLVDAPVLTLTTGESTEGGVLGITLHPEFASNSLFYIFYTTTENGGPVNRVERFKLSADHTSATSDRVILDGIQTGTFHDGGRLKFGPDSMLYISTGDARDPDLAQDSSSLNGKILRVTADGGIPGDNPFPGSAVWAKGVRNTEAFDWVDSKTIILADNGPTGELNLTGLDKVSFAQAGDNLGWPTITGCQAQSGLITPMLSWSDSAPPGGGLIYHSNGLGTAIPEFDGNFLIGMMGIGDGTALQLHRVVFNSAGAVALHEVYLKDQFGRLRDVEQAPDGTLYITTTNCDSRGTCPSDGDYILKITHG